MRDRKPFKHCPGLSPALWNRYRHCGNRRNCFSRNRCGGNEIGTSIQKLRRSGRHLNFHCRHDCIPASRDRDPAGAQGIER